MANEISFTASLSARKGSANVASGNVAEQLTMAGTDMIQATQLIASGAWTLVSFGAITGAPAKVLLVNMDAVNYIETAEDNAGAHKHNKILAGDFVLISPESATLYAKANTADAELFVVAVEA